MRALVWVLPVLIVAGGALGAAGDPGSPWSGALRGVGFGLAVAVAAGVHLVVRSFGGLGAEAGSPEADADSVEQRAWQVAASRTCADAVGVLALLALLCALSDGATVRWLPVAALVVVLVDLAVRLRLAWRAEVGAGA